MQTSHKGLFGSTDGGFDSPDRITNDPAAGWRRNGPSNGLNASVEQTAAIGDLGTIASFAEGGTAGSTSTVGSSTAASAPTEVTTAGSGMVINLDWDSSVSGGPAGFVSDVIAAAQFLEGQITSAVTITLDVGYDEIDGSALQGGALGESEANIESVSYPALVAALKETASKDPVDAAVLAALPATSPVSGIWWVTTAQAKALGLSPADGTGIDGAIGFGSSSEFTYGITTTSGTVAAGTYDFFATAVHEMTETMGRILLVGSSIDNGPGYSLLDLLHYSAAGTRDFTQSSAGYFSVNGGATNLGEFNTVAGGDPGDWATSITNNSFDAYAAPGVIEAVTGNDLTEMDAIGWNLNGLSVTETTPTPTPPEVTDQTVGQTWTEGQSISLTLPANTFTDPEGQALTYKAGLANGQALPSWLTFNPATETFTGTAPSTATSLNIMVTATSSSELSGSETFAASVVAPGISVTDQTPNQTWTGGQTVDLMLPSSTFTDALGLKMTFKAYEVSGTNVASWLRFNATTDTFSGQVPAAESGSVQLEVIAEDSRSMMATDLFNVTFAAAGALHGGSMSISTGMLGLGPFNQPEGPGTILLHGT